MTPQQLAQIIKWTKSEYTRRTRLLKSGEARIDWLNPGTRVSLTEIRSHADGLGISINVNDTTEIFHALKLKT